MLFSSSKTAKYGIAVIESDFLSKFILRRIIILENNKGGKNAI